LPDARVQAEIAYKLLWFVEAGHVADCRLHRQCDGHINAGNGHQPLYAFILKSRAGEIALDDLEIFAQPVELSQMPINREALVLRHDLLAQPRPALGAAQVGMRAGRDEVAMKDRLDDIL